MAKKNEAMAKVDAAIQGNHTAQTEKKQSGADGLWKAIGENVASIYANTITKEQCRDLVFGAFRETPKLANCTPASLVHSIMLAGRLNIVFNSPLGQAWLVPRFNSDKGVTECSLQLGYKGLLALVRRSGEVLSVHADVVRENDEFEFKNGTEYFLHHSWTFKKDRGQVVGVFATAKLRGGESQFAVLSFDDVEKIRLRSPSSDSPAWRNSWDEMAKKTALNRLSKTLPMSIEVQDSISKATELEDGGEVPNVDVPKELLGPAPEPQGQIVEKDGRETANDISSIAPAETVNTETGEILPETGTLFGDPMQSTPQDLEP